MLEVEEILMLYVPSPVMSDVTSISYHALVETAPTVASSALSLAGALFQVTVLSLHELSVRGGAVRHRSLGWCSRCGAWRCSRSGPDTGDGELQQDVLDRAVVDAEAAGCAEVRRRLVGPDVRIVNRREAEGRGCGRRDRRRIAEPERLAAASKARTS